MTAMTDEPELDALIEEIRGGRQEAFAELVALVQSRVRAWASRFTEDADDADDVAQEVLIGLERGVQQYHGRSRFTTWLYSVTRNAAFNRRRSEDRRAELRVERGLAEPIDAEGLDAHDQHTVADLVLKYFDALPARQRLVFELIDLRGESPSEVAQRLGMRSVTVRAHLFKARRAIRARMLELHEPLMKEFLS